jgi:hypothetical protein
MTVPQQLIYSNNQVTWNDKTKTIDEIDEFDSESIHLTLEGTTYFFYVQYTTVNNIKYNNSTELIAALTQ